MRTGKKQLEVCEQLGSNQGLSGWRTSDPETERNRTCYCLPGSGHAPGTGLS
jgi:hypothetical protein